MNLLVKYMSLLMLCLLFYYLVDMGNTAEHEELHKKIFEDYNISSKVVINYNPITVITNGGVSGTTYPDANESYRCNQNCQYEQTLNDIVGYNTVSMISTVVLMTMLLIFIIVIVGDN